VHVHVHVHAQPPVLTRVVLRKVQVSPTGIAHYVPEHIEPSYFPLQLHLKP